MLGRPGSLGAPGASDGGGSALALVGCTSLELEQGRLPFADGAGSVTGWETSEHVLESGGFESRQRVLVAEPVVEASEAGARTLGVTFGPPELSFDGGLVSCRHAIQGGLLALRAGGAVTLAQRPEGDQQEPSVMVEGYLPRLAARVGAPPWTGMLYARGQSPVHAAVSFRYFE